MEHCEEALKVSGVFCGVIRFHEVATIRLHRVLGDLASLCAHCELTISQLDPKSN